VYTQFGPENLKGRHHLVEIDIDGRTILE